MDNYGPPKINMLSSAMASGRVAPKRSSVIRTDKKSKWCGQKKLSTVLLVVLVVAGIVVLVTLFLTEFRAIWSEIKSRPPELVRAKGLLRVTSDQFSAALIDKNSLEYISMETKYSKMITTTYERSDLAEAFVETVIHGFTAGSLVVHFEVVFDQR